MPTSCPCGSCLPLASCCAPRHDGTSPAPTPEALMRSRYSAFALGLGDYLVATHDVPAEPGEAAAMSAWGRSVTWLGLTVREVEGVSSEQGYVTFAARYLEGAQVCELGERSRFVLRDGRWLYADGVSGVTRQKVARNDDCPCGSGKKFKHCHA